MPRFSDPSGYRTSLLWALVATSAGAAVVFALTAFSLSPLTRLRGFYVPYDETDEGTIHWGRGYSKVEMPLLMWRPTRITMDIRGPRGAPDSIARAILAVDDLPLGQLRAAQHWNSPAFLVRAGRPFEGLTLRITSETATDHGLGIGRVRAVPAGISWSSVALLAIGAALGFLIWLPSPQARPVVGDLRPQLLAGIVLIATLLPLFYLARGVFTWGVDVPSGDQWEFVPMLEAAHRGTLAVGDLWRQHNEHRPFFPRLVMLVLAGVSGWNVSWEMWFSVALAATTCLVLVVAVRRALAAAGGARHAIWLVPAVSVVTFSMAQFENWLSGWQLTIFMNALAVVTGVVLLTGDRRGPLRFAAALAAGAVATGSFANGLLFWPLGLGLVALLWWRSPGRTWFILTWCLCGAAVTILYLHGFTIPGLPPPSGVARLDARVDRYVLTYLGTPLTTGPGAWLAGLTGLAVLGVSTWLVVRSKLVDRRIAAPFWGLAAYSIGSALVTAAGRLSQGAGQARASRYVTFGNLLWVADLSLLAIVASSAGIRAAGRAGTAPGRWVPRGALVLAVAIGCWATFHSVENRLAFVLWNQRLSLAREALRNVDTADDRVLILLYPSPGTVRDRAAVLKALHLSVFRPVP